MNEQLARTNAAAERARQLMRSGNLAAAEAECRRALSLSPRVNGRVWNTDALRLLGNIYLRQGRNQEALQCFLGSSHNTRSVALNLDVALAYCRLGNYREAKRFYSDEAVLQYVAEDAREEFRRAMPGTADLRSLEASIRFAQGADLATSAAHEEAVEHFQAALRLTPNNGWIASSAAKSLVYLKRRAEAEQYFRMAARYGRGRIAREAKARVAGYDAWHRAHPTRK